MTAWLEVLSVARTRLVDRLCDPSASDSSDTQQRLLSVLDVESLIDVATERASTGLCGNPTCREELTEKNRSRSAKHRDPDSGRLAADDDGDDGDEDASGSDQDDPTSSDDEAGRGPLSRSPSMSGDDNADADADDGVDDCEDDDETVPARRRTKKKQKQGYSTRLARALFCSSRCRQAVRHRVSSARTLSDNDATLINDVLDLFPGLKQAMSALSDQRGDIAGKAKIVERKSTRDELVRRIDEDAAAQREHDAKLGMVPSSSSSPVGVGQPPAATFFAGKTWMSVAARAFSLAFQRVSPKTVRVFRTGALGAVDAFTQAVQQHKANPPAPYKPPPGVDSGTLIFRRGAAGPSAEPTFDAVAAGSVFSSLAEQLPIATWGAAGGLPEVPPSGLQGVERQRVVELRREFTQLLSRELRRAALLLRVDLVENTDVMRVIAGVASTFDMKDLARPHEAPGGIGVRRSDPDAETCLVFVLGVLVAAAVSEPVIRDLLMPVEPALLELLDAMHVKTPQFVRLATLFFDA